jgi:hypothetical protein
VRDRYAWYDKLSGLADEARAEGAYELAAALHAMAHLVLTEREEQAAALLQHLPVRR